MLINVCTEASVGTEALIFSIKNTGKNHLPNLALSKDGIKNQNFNWPKKCFLPNITSMSIRLVN